MEEQGVCWGQSGCDSPFYDSINSNLVCNIDSETRKPKRNIVKPACCKYSSFFADPIDEAKGIKEWECTKDEEMDALGKQMVELTDSRLTSCSRIFSHVWRGL